MFNSVLKTPLGRAKKIWLFSLKTAWKMTFSIKDVFGKLDQIRILLRIWSYLLKKPLMENFIFCAVDLFHATGYQKTY